MDQLTPFQVYLLEKLDFEPNTFEVYQGGEMVDCGPTSMKIRVRAVNRDSICQDNIWVTIEDNNLLDRLDSISSFDLVMTLHNRFIAIILPQQSNIDDVMFTAFRQAVNCTRDEKSFEDREPLCMCMFTENGRVVKMSFKVYSPETLIELSI